MPTFDPSRRRFLTHAAIAGAAVTLGEMAWPGARAAMVTGAKSDEVTPPGFERPMRWVQLAFVDDDPAKIDAAFWYDFFARTHADGVCLTAGGCTAFYPTKVPWHHRSAWLGTRDLFGDFAAHCHVRDMTILARVDPHATYDDVAAAHPGWIAVGEDGRPRRHWTSPDMWVTCGLGPYNYDFLSDVMREIVASYPVAGIFVNRWEGSGPCYCAHCREMFHAATGHELPRSSTPRHDPVRRAYTAWRQERLFEIWQHWDAAVQSVNRDARVIPNTAGGPSGSLDMARAGVLAPMLVADRQARHGAMPLWMAGRSAKEYRAAVASRKPVCGLFGVGFEEPYRWKDSVTAPEEIRLWALDTIANGARPWVVKFAGHLEDPRWVAPVEKVFAWCAGAERYLRNDRPLARVGVVYSQQTLAAAEHPERIDDAGRGWYQALIEARVPFELVHDRRLEAGDLAGLKTLVLPDLAALSDAQCAQLRAFVARGGGLVATGETSLRDEMGAPRSDFGLADLFGVSFAGKIDGPMHNAYLRLEHDRAPDHPLLRGLDAAPRTIHGVWRVEVKPTAEFPPAPLTLIPAYPDLPMEKVYAREPRTDIAQVFLRERPGGGRVVYFPWDIDRTFWEVLDPDHGRLLRNALDWATAEPPPVEVTGPGVLDVTYWRQHDSATIHLVNLTNPMLMKGPVREVFPVGAQRVRARLPAGVRARAVRLLVAEATVDFRQDSDRLECTVPAVAEHEVIAIDL